MNRLKNADLVGGIVLMLIGLYFFFGAFRLDIGTPSRMGPGFYPMVVSAAVLIFAILIVLQSLRRDQVPGAIAVRPMLAVFAGIAAFGVAMNFVGFVPANFVAVAIAAYGDKTATIRRALILAVFTTALAWVVFDLLLGLPMPAFKGL